MKAGQVAHEAGECITEGPAARRTRDANATAAALLEAARHRFAHYGYDATGMRDIAADVGVNPALLYRYFGSKEKLFVECLAAGRHPREIIQGPLEDLGARWVDWIRAPIASFGGVPLLVWLLRSSGHPGVVELLRERTKEQFIDELAARLDGPDASVRATLVSALLYGASLLQAMLDVEELNEVAPERLSELVTQMLHPLLFPGRSDA